MPRRSAGILSLFGLCPPEHAWSVWAERTSFTEYEWYVLVGLRGELERPEFFIVPRDFVAAFTWVSHRRWLSEEGRSGPHKNSQMRSIRGEWIGDFRERWDILERSTYEVESSHDAWVLEQARSFGLPDGHRWADPVAPT